MFKKFNNWPTLVWMFTWNLHMILWGNFCVYCVISKVFYFSSLWCSQTRDHPQEDLVKFGYRQYIYLKNNPLMFWLLAKTCCRNLAILIFLKIWSIGAILFTKLLSTCQNHNFPVNSPPKKHYLYALYILHIFKFSKMFCDVT